MHMVVWNPVLLLLSCGPWPRTGKIDGAKSYVEQPGGLVQGTMVLPLFMEQVPHAALIA
jgi:hypothetical protein